MAWIVSIPVWGHEYVQTFIRHALPSLKVAVAALDCDVHFLVHTDARAKLEEQFKGFSVEFSSLPSESKYIAFAYAHREAIERAQSGDRVVLLTADVVVSNNLFTRCEAHIQAGKKAVVLGGIRTAPTSRVPLGSPPRALLEWGIEQRHQIIRDLEWGQGRSGTPSNLFFFNCQTVVLRGFHLHPIAIMKGAKELRFNSTIDADLLTQFATDDIHVVCDPDDLAVIEITDAKRRFPVTKRLMTPATVAEWARRRTLPIHRWLFQHRIILRGTDQECGDTQVAQQILSAI